MKKIKTSYTEKEPLKVFTAFSGYDSQCMALDRIGIPYELVGWCEIDKYAIQAHNAVYPQWSNRNYGDISKIDWAQVPDFELFTYSSPCFVSGTLVLTDKGYKPIEDITADDSVLTEKNVFKRVLTPMKTPYKGKMYKLNVSCADEVVCTPNHPFLVREMERKGHDAVRTFSEPKWMNPAEMVKRKAEKKRNVFYVGYAINTESRIPDWNGTTKNYWGHNKPCNDIKPLLDKGCFWYLMGRYVGDGWQGGANRTIICCGGRYEQELKDNLNQCGFHFSVFEERTVRKYCVTSKELSEFVQRFGKYAHGKVIDYDTMCLPKHLLLSFLQGILESDGCCIDGLYKVTSVSRKLIYGIGQCVAKAYERPFSIYCYKRPSTCTIEGRVVNQRDSYMITWRTEQHKQSKLFYENGYAWMPIKRIDEVEQSEEIHVYNMEVEDVHSYTANGLIAHNCQDFSTAGLQRGAERGSGTRSSLLWECEKAIEAKRPKFLVFENVKALVSKKFIRVFGEWQRILEDLGYKNYYQVLNSKDYGVPQNRERVFMVSIKDGFYPYTFPKPFPLEMRLKDVLEENVAENYYLSDAIVQRFVPQKAGENIIGTTKGDNGRIGNRDVVYNGGGTSEH